MLQTNAWMDNTISRVAFATENCVKGVFRILISKLSLKVNFDQDRIYGENKETSCCKLNRGYCTYDL